MQWRLRFQRLFSRLAPRISATPSPGEPPRTPRDAPQPKLRRSIEKDDAIAKLHKTEDTEGGVHARADDEEPSQSAKAESATKLATNHDAKRFPKRVLFVCSGNICRSPYGEHVFRHLAKENSFATQVFSAGTLRISGEKAAPLMQRAATEIGYDLSQHLSSPLSKVLIDASELIFVMSPEHREEVLRLSPSADSKCFILAHWLNPAKHEIPDPMGRSYRHYRRAVAEIDAAIERWFSDFKD